MLETSMKVREETAVAVETPIQNKSRPVLNFRFNEWRIVLMFTDLMGALLAAFIGLFIWARVAHGNFSYKFVANHIYWIALLPLLWLFLSIVNDAYRLRYASTPFRTLRTLFFIELEFIILYLAVFFFVPRNLLPRLFILFFGILVYIIVCIARLGRTVIMNKTGIRRRVVIVGTGPVASMMILALKNEAAKEYNIIGCVASIYDAPSIPTEVEFLGFGHDLQHIIQQHHIAEIIMTYINEIPEDIFDGLIECYQIGAMVTPMPQLYEEVTGRVPIEHIGQRLWSLVLPSDTQSLGRRINGAIKRIIDIVLALICLICFAPFLPFIALLIKSDSRGPVFFFQHRVGLGGHPFTIIKLRSMITDAEKNKGPLWASADDPRITRLGRVLRKTRIDEIPQLINVLRGDMSFVGPRPERPEFVELLAGNITFYKTRLVVKPGLTGWAQIRYRYGGSVEDALYKLQYDMYYIRHQSLLLDLIILLRTFVTVLRFQGT